MNPVDVRYALEDRGLKLTLKDGKIGVSPARLLTPQVRAVIGYYKPALVALLEQDARLHPIQAAIRPDARGPIYRGPQIVRLDPPPAAAPETAPAPAAPPAPVQEAMF